MSQYNINLSFTADTNKAKQQILNLTKEINNLANTTQLGSKNSIYQIDDQMHKASIAARELEVALSLALNPKTGKLDLSRFQDALKRTGKDLNYFEKNLTAIGPQGQQVFEGLCTSIMQAELPLKRTSQLVDKLWNSLKNTMTWQISSSITHNLWGSIEKAYNYSKDLNRSLTDIQIVTNQNNAQMAKFAQYANQAAKSLNTTTTKYTDASLIYFQQGLSEQEVIDRTNVTVKMANVTGESVAEISEQLTAVWNNFYDGSKSLDYYADVMAALGAATASSSDEISQGLNKFAATAETVGLSYEYAASALATVTATTRESADIVGNAFKTLFARIQGLQLGETLDDGTTLNKYSEALDVVGISIKDQFGNMKNMDEILNEMGEKWKTLAKDEQLALAQTVAGVRQYAQLIALMDNWDYFNENLETAYEATGALAQQADIYAKSWEGARRRVQTTAEGIYQSLLNDEFFIDLTNSAANFLSILQDIIDGMGGMKGILSAVGVVITKVASNQVANTLRDMAYNVKSLTGINQKEAIGTKQKAGQLLANQYYADDMNSDISGDVIAKAEKERAKLQLKYINNADKLNEIEAKNLQIVCDSEEKLIDKMKIIDTTTQKLKSEKEGLQGNLNVLLSTNQALEDNNELINSLGLVQKMEFNNKKGARDALSGLSKNKDLKKLVAGDSGLKGLYDDLINDMVAMPQGTYNANKNYFDDLAAKYNNFVSEVRKYGTIIDAKAEISQFTKIQKELGRFKLANTDNVSGITKDNLGYARDYGEMIERISNNLSGLVDEQGKDLINESDVAKFTALTEKIKKDINLTDNEIKELDTLFKQFNSTLKGIDNNQSIDNLIKKLNLTEEGAKEVKQLLERIKQIELEGGSSDEEMMQLLSIFQARSKEGEGLLGKPKEKDWANVAVEIANVASSMTFFSSSLNGAMDAWSDGKIDLQDLTATVSMLGGGVSAAKSAFDLLNKTFSVSTKMAAGVSIGLTALTAVIAILINLQQQKIEIIEEEAKKSAEIADAAQKEYDSMASLGQAYEDAYNSFKKTGEGKEDLIDLAGQLSDAYQIEGAEVLALAGNYDQLAESIRKKRIAELGGGEDSPGVIETTQDALNAAEKAFLINSNSKLLTGFSGSEENNQIIDLINQGQFDYINGLKGDIVNGQYLSTLKINSGENIEDAIAAYEEVKSLVEQSSGIEGIENSGLYKDLTNWLSASQAQYENYLQIKADLEKYTLEEAVLTGEIKNSEGTVTANIGDINKINSFEGYQNYRSKLINAKAAAEGITEGTEEWDNLTAAVDRYLSTIGNVSEYAQVESGLELLAETTGYTREQLDGLYAKYGEYVFSIRFDMDENSFDSQVKQAKLKAEETEIQLKLTTVEEGQDLIDDKKAGAKEWTNWANDINWSEFGKVTGQESGFGIGDYLTLSKEEQTRFLDQYEKFLEEKERLNQEAQIKEVEHQLELERNKIAAQEEAQGVGTAADPQLKARIAELEAELASLKNEDEVTEAIGWKEDFNKSVEAIGLDVDEVYELSEVIEGLDENLKNLSEETLLELSKSVKQTQNGFSKLEKNFKDWKKAIQGKDILKSAEAMADLKDSLADVLNISDELAESGIKLGDHFGEYVAENMDVVEKAISGNKDALFELSRVAAEDILIQIGYDEETLTASGENAWQLVSNQMDVIQAMVNSKELEFGPVNDTALLSSLEGVINSLTNDVGEAQRILAGLGFDATVKPVDVEETTTRTYQTLNVTADEFGLPKITQGEPLVLTDTVSGQVGTALEIETADYVGGGNISTAPSTKAGSGGGGGKKSTKKASKEIDRNHEIKAKISVLANDYDKISKAKDRAFGPSRLKYIDQEIAKLDQLQKSQKSYLEALEGNVFDDKNALSVYGVQFNEDGTIKNPEDIVDQWVKAFNAEKLTDEQYQERMDAFSQYEESYKEFMDAEQQYIDYLNEEVSKRIEAIDTEVTLRIDVQDDKLKYLEYLLDKFDDDIYDIAKAINALGKQAQSTIFQGNAYKDGLRDMLSKKVDPETGKNIFTENEINTLLDSSSSTDDVSNILNRSNVTFSEEEMSQIRNYRDGLISSNSSLKDIYDTVHDKILDAWDDWNEKFDEQIEKFDHYNSLVENYRNIVDLIGKDSLGISDDIMAGIDKTMVDNQNNKVSGVKTKLSTLTNSRIEAEAGLADAIQRGNEEDIKKWEDILKTINSDIADTQEELMSEMATSAEYAGMRFQNSVNRALENYEKSLTGVYGTFENLQNAFDQHQEKSERFLSEYEQMYELSKLTRNIANSIDDTDNLKAKKELKKLEEGIQDIQENNTKLSQYDLEALQKRYDLKLAEIALEEAQNAKSQVMMQRDAEGNWSYVYTANEEETAKAQENYEKALYDLQSLNENYLNELQGKIIQSQSEMAQALSALDQTQFATQEEYQQAVDRITAYYTEQQEYYYDQIENALGNNVITQDAYIEHYYKFGQSQIDENIRITDEYGNTIQERFNYDQKYTDDQYNEYLNRINNTSDYIGSIKGFETGLTDSLSETFLGRTLGYSNVEEAQNDLKDNTDIFSSSVKSAFSTWDQDVNAVFVSAGTTAEEFAKDMADAVGDGTEEGTITKASNDVVSSISSIGDEMEKVFNNETLTALKTWQQQYSKEIQNAIDSNETLIESYNRLLQIESGVDDDGNLPEPKPEEPTEPPQEPVKEEPKIPETPSKPTWDRVVAAYDKINGGVWGDSIDTRISKGKKDGFTEEEVRLGQQLITYQYPSSLGGYGYTRERAKQIMGYNTGGYTGAWGQEGRLAILHQKELVLNADDTMNLLKAVEIIRNISNIIDLHAGMQSLGIGALNASTIGNNSQVIEQQVTIHAEFPNAVDHNEIEEAFNTLINSASQFANRKNK